jgi:hypothetical protein
LTKSGLNIEVLLISNASKPELAAVSLEHALQRRQDMPKIRILGFGLAAVLVLLGSASSAWCNSASIVVDPDPGIPPPGEFWYSLAVTGGITFNPGDYIYFSGMSGVTNAFANANTTIADTELLAAFGNFVTFTSTTATFAFGFSPSCTSCPTSDTFPDDGGAPYGTLVIDPPAGTTLGTIDWAIIQDGVTTYSGTVEGPVASTPEPGTIGLMVLGLGLLVVMRKRITWCLPQGN